MTIQEAAHEILKDLGKPLSSKDIARIALEKNKVRSNAQDPTQSHAQTIEKNIRDRIYNKPKLIFINSPQGRLIGLPEWDSDPSITKNIQKQNLSELRVQIPIELLEKIRLAEQAKLENNFDETVSLILNRGLSSLSDEIKKNVMEKLNSLDSTVKDIGS